jgi:diacylglycerol kinase (ATP)
MRRRFFLIANPGAGLTGSPLLDGVANLLLSAGAELTLTQPGDIDTARRQVREAAACSRFDAILAAGGDGTIRQVAAALIGTDTPLGIVPVGTGNVLAHEIGLAPEVRTIQAVCARPTTSRSC